MTAWAESNIQIVGLASVEQSMYEQGQAFDGCAPFLRGHANKDWSLQPRVFRPVSRPDGTMTTFAEANLLWEFMMRATPGHGGSPNWDDKLGWVMLAQHYGLPTRFLDWTRSLEMALFFAVEDVTKDNVDGCLWALWPDEVNREQVNADGLITPAQPVLEAMLDDALGNEVKFSPLPTVFAMPARQNDLRMMVQQSVFTVHSNSADLQNIPFGIRVLMHEVRCTSQ